MQFLPTFAPKLHKPLQTTLVVLCAVDFQLMQCNFPMYWVCAVQFSGKIISKKTLRFYVFFADYLLICIVKNT